MAKDVFFYFFKKYIQITLKNRIIFLDKSIAKYLNLHAFFGRKKYYFFCPKIDTYFPNFSQISKSKSDSGDVDVDVNGEYFKLTLKIWSKMKWHTSRSPQKN